MSLNWTNVKSLAIPVGGTARDVKRVSIGGSVVWEKNALPYDAEVEYLQSTGTQYINTGVVSSGIDIKCTMAFTDNTTANQGVFGSRVRSGDTGSNAYQIWYNVAADKLRLDWANYTKSATVALNTPVDIEAYQNGSIFVNGTEYTGSTKTANAYNFYIFNFNQGGTLGTTGCRARLYSFKIYVNGVLVRDYIPVRKSGVGYLYDRVTGQLYGNAGTGDFVLGQDVVPVEYIESHGTEYIDTGVLLESNSRIECDFLLRQSATQAVFGQIINSNTGIFFGTAPNSSVYCNKGISPISPALTLSANTEYSVVQQGNSIVVNGVEYSTNGATNLTASALLFARRENNVASRIISGYIRRWDVYTNTSDPIRNLRPVRVGTEGAMIDTLTRRIYRNAGTGAFTYGNDLPLETLAN